MSKQLYNAIDKAIHNIIANVDYDFCSGFDHGTSKGLKLGIRGEIYYATFALLGTATVVALRQKGKGELYSMSDSSIISHDPHIEIIELFSRRVIAAL